MRKSSQILKWVQYDAKILKQSGNYFAVLKPTVVAFPCRLRGIYLLLCDGMENKDGGVNTAVWC